MSLVGYQAPTPGLKPSAMESQMINSQVQQSIAQTIEANSGKFIKTNNTTTVKVKSDMEYVVRIAEKRQDPLDPPRSRHRKPVPLQQEDPAPILTKPAQKLTEEEIKAWEIPTCVSRYKNPQGYVIPMDKRIGADATRFEQPAISDKFAIMARTLEITSQAINETVAQRNLIQRQLAQKRQREEEERVREEARRFREEKRQLAKIKTKEEKRRESIYAQQREDRQRLRKKLQERDISESVALGQTVTRKSLDDEFDAQVYGQTSGVGVGYGLEDANEVYDQPLLPAYDNKPYVPFADDRQYNASKCSIAIGETPSNNQGSGYTVQTTFKQGARQEVSQRAGLYIPPSSKNINNDNDY